MRFFKKKEEESLDALIKELKLSGCPLCRPLARGASVTKTFHLPNKDEVQLELVDERANQNRKCLTLCVLNDPTLGWAEAPVRFCPRCGTNLLALIKQEKDA